MAIDLDLFSSSNFGSTIRRYCNQLGWRINDLNDCAARLASANRRSILKFTAESGNTQTLFIIRYENTLEFSVPSAVKFNTTDDVPGWMSTMLMCKNSEYKIGFWCIENIDGRKVFSIMHNAEISLINVDYFKKVVLKLVSDCDEFEQAVVQALRSY